MTLRTFWTIFIKILGIFLIVDSITVLPQSAINLAMIFYGDQQLYFLSLIAALLLTIGIYLIIIKHCIYDPAWLIDKLKLDQGFAEGNLNLNLDKKTVLTITTIVLGGLLFVENLPILCQQLFVFYKEEALSGAFGDKPSVQWLIMYLIQTLTGYLIITNHAAIVDFIRRQNEETDDNNE